MEISDLIVAQISYCENKGASSELVHSANYEVNELNNFWTRLSSPIKENEFEALSSITLARSKPNSKLMETLSNGCSDKLMFDGSQFNSVESNILMQTIFFLLNYLMWQQSTQLNWFSECCRSNTNCPMVFRGAGSFS